MYVWLYACKTFSPYNSAQSEIELCSIFSEHAEIRSPYPPHTLGFHWSDKGGAKWLKRTILYLASEVWQQKTRPPAFQSLRSPSSLFLPLGFSVILGKQLPYQEAIMMISVSLFQVVQPSNHATFQSILKAVGIVPGIPEPCCVPSVMNPLSVLFLDESQNVVLKVYPNMSIHSCACR